MTGQMTRRASLVFKLHQLANGIHRHFLHTWLAGQRTTAKGANRELPIFHVLHQIISLIRSSETIQDTLIQLNEGLTLRYHPI